MKTIKPLFSLLLVALLGMGMNAYSQRTITVTLKVNTASITSSTTDKYSNFGQAAGVSNKNYTIHAKKGDIIRWVGVSTSSSKDVVEIVSINHEGGARVFGKNVLQGSNGVVTGVVTSQRNGDTEKYQVAFRVKNNGVARGGLYLIDPKIVIKQ